MRFVQEIRNEANQVVFTATNNTEGQELWGIFSRMIRRKQKATILFVIYDDEGKEVRSTVAKKYRPRD